MTQKLVHLLQKDTSAQRKKIKPKQAIGLVGHTNTLARMSQAVSGEDIK
jgi:hypothetical protein